MQRQGDTPSLGDPVADRIRQALRLAPGTLSRTQIRDLFHRNRSRAEINRALALLLDLGLATFGRLPTYGRPLELWVPADSPLAPYLERHNARREGRIDAGALIQIPSDSLFLRDNTLIDLSKPFVSCGIRAGE